MNSRIKIACCGDSLTEGMYGITYVDFLKKSLGGHFEIGNFGAVGTTAGSGFTGWLRTNQFPRAATFKPEIVILTFGANDSGLYGGAGGFADHYRETVKTLMEIDSVRAALLLSPTTPYRAEGETSGPYAFGVCPENYPEIIASIQRVSRELGQPWVDLYHLTENHRDWFSFDGVHPNRTGAEKMAEAVKAALMPVIASLNKTVD